MKKILLIILAFILLNPFTIVYGDEIEYSEWSTEQKGYSREEKAIQYGVLEPKTWSKPTLEKYTGNGVLPIEPKDNRWYINDSIDFTDHKFQITKDFGGNSFANDRENKTWTNAKEKTLYTWNFSEPQHVTSVYVDVDCCYYDINTDYVGSEYQPVIVLYIDHEFVAKSEPTTNLLVNWHYYTDIIASSVEIKMQSAEGGGRNLTVLYGNTSYVTTQNIKYSHVIEWEEPKEKCWEFNTPYELLDDESRGVVSKGDETTISQIPVERIIYRYPINPIINVQNSVLYEDDDFEYIEGLASAINYDDTDITGLIKVTTFEYITVDENGIEHFSEPIYNPSEFVPALGDKLRVTYFVENELNCTDTKVITMIIIKTGVLYDLKIFNRYISKEYISTLNNNSLWLNDEYKQRLDDAIEWLERK